MMNSLAVSTELTRQGENERKGSRVTPGFKPRDLRK